MMTDIGLHLNIEKLKDLERLTPADLECRKRLYFSAFIWDKTLSLALGRPPTLTKLAHSVEDLSMLCRFHFFGPILYLCDYS